jgi:hypothetical protein
MKRSSTARTPVLVAVAVRAAPVASPSPKSYRKWLAFQASRLKPRSQHAYKIAARRFNDDVGNEASRRADARDDRGGAGVASGDRPLTAHDQPSARPRHLRAAVGAC